MRNQAIGVSALVFMLLGLVATVCLFAFEDGIRRLEWIDLETAGLGTAVICLVGCILGWASFRTAPGRAAAILGGVLVLFFLYQYMRGDSPRRRAAPDSPAPTEEPGSARNRLPGV